MSVNVIDVRNELTTYWLDNYSTTPTLYSNVTLPDILKVNPFVMFEIEFTGSKTVGSGTDGGTQTRHMGFIAVTVNTPLGSGNNTAYTLASSIINILERKRINSVSTYAGYVDDERNNGEHYQIVVMVPFKTTVG